MKTTDILENLDLEIISDIEVSYLKGSCRSKKHLDILIVKYSGKYKVGSAGNEDARYMFAKAQYGLNCIEPAGVILDLSDVDYVWGDMMELVFSVGMNQYENVELPLTIIIGSKCQKAIGTLIYGIDSKELATSKDCIFDNFEQAWEFVEKKVENQKILFSRQLRQL